MAGRRAQLPVKADVRKAIGKGEGDTVTVRLPGRLSSWPPPGSGGAPRRRCV
ncbi:DUF1905 domain-containing protein [Streptomyces sp. NPDC001450]